MPPEMEEGLSTSASPTDTSSTATPDSTEASSTSDSNVDSSPQDAATGSNEGKAKTSAEAIMDSLGLQEEGGKLVATATDKSSAEAPPASADAKTDPAAKDKPQATKPDTKTGTDDEMYKVPEGLKAVAAERFQKLATGHKELSEKLKTVETERNTFQQDSEGFRAAIEYSQAEPEEFRELLEYSHLVKSGNLNDALKILDKHRMELAKFVSVPVDGVDQFEDFPDLKEKMEKYELTTETALELAQARRVRAAQEQSRQQHTVQQQQQRESQGEINTAITAISTQESQWKAKDIDFAVKAPLLLRHVETVCKKYPPNLWQQAMEDYYQSLSAMKTAVTNPPATPQPLRSGGRGGKAEPRDSTDAVMQTLGLS